MSTIQDAGAAHRPAEIREDPVARWLPLTGVAYAVLAIAGTLTIDKFPDENTSTQSLVRYYAAHHAQVRRGGELATLGCVFLGLFVASLVARSRRQTAIAAVIAVGGAALLAAEVYSDSTYALLGSISTDSHLSPQALQAWHISGAAFGSNAGACVLLLGVALAGIVGRTLPRWVGWSALVLGVAVMTPGIIGFLATLVLVLWTIAVGIALAVRGPVTD
jgi:hypothetical protein